VNGRRSRRGPPAGTAGLKGTPPATVATEDEDEDEDEDEKWDEDTLEVLFNETVRYPYFQEWRNCLINDSLE
jgi:hypothetical protein